MDDSDLRLDGNAVAGLLGEVFAFDPSGARARCAGCGAVAELGADPAYTRAPGIVVRCRGCDGVLVVLVSAPESYRLSLSGTAWIEIR